MLVVGQGLLRTDPKPTLNQPLEVSPFLNLGPYKTLFSDRERKRIVLASILPRLAAGIDGLSLTLSAWVH